MNGINKKLVIGSIGRIKELAKDIKLEEYEKRKDEHRKFVCNKNKKRIQKY